MFLNTICLINPSHTLHLEQSQPAMYQIQPNDFVDNILLPFYKSPQYPSLTFYKSQKQSRDWLFQIPIQVQIYYQKFCKNLYQQLHTVEMQDILFSYSEESEYLKAYRIFQSVDTGCIKSNAAFSDCTCEFSLKCANISLRTI